MGKVKFGSIIADVNRGIRIKSSDLDKLMTYDETDTQYMNVKNLEDGTITGEMPYIGPLASKYEKYCLQNGDLVMTKSGYPPKIMVTDLKQGKKILASGNFYIITLNQEKADPNYIAAYLNSAKGRLSLADASIGERTPTISLKELKSIDIPLPPLEAQRKIGDEYKDLIKELIKLKSKEEMTRKQLENIM